MHLHRAPSLAAVVPGFSQAQLDALARSVEARRCRLEDDINAYIARKQHELSQYETELVETLRSMERDGDAGAALDAASDAASDAAARHSNAATVERPETAVPQSQSQSQSQLQSQPQSQSQSQPQPRAVPEEQKKQKKHGRVHKREKELYGLVTPVFLPLLDAHESTSPEKKPRPEPSTPAKDADGSKDNRKAPKDSTHPAADMAGDAPAKERSASDPGKKRRSSIKKKSALRHSSTPRNRKRVSLVIDDQVVLPSDVIQEPALTSPGSETTSATASTASLDDRIDPRLTSDAPVYIEHHDAVHHSLPLTMMQPKTSPIKSSAPPFSTPAPVVAEAAHSPPTSPAVMSPAVTSPTIPYAPPSYATRSFLDPPPEQMHIEDLPSTAGPAPIYPDLDDPADQFASRTAEPEDEGFQTYVGGLSGSGVDDVNQAGSVGYPSSLGASYLESYMQTRPLSVRMAAAQREGDANEVLRLRGLEERRKAKESLALKQPRDVDEWDVPAAKGKDVDDDDFMGSMDDF